VTVDDDFGASTVVVRQARRLCAPVNKNHEDPTAPSHPGHLTTYTIRQSAPHFTRVKGLSIADQLGSHTVDLIRPERMLVPTAKSTTSTPPALASALDHFKCYRVRSRRSQVPDATVETQFGELTVAIRRPRHLCIPADKNGEGIDEPRIGLMCYQVRPRSISSPPHVFTTDQFGSADYDLFNVRDLCVPLTAGPGTCGDGRLNAPDEQCESGAGNEGACPGACDTATCTCPTTVATCPCEGLEVEGAATWDESLAGTTCVTTTCRAGTPSAFPCTFYQHVDEPFCELRVDELAVPSCSVSCQQPFSPIGIPGLTPAEVEACRQSIKAIAAANGTSCNF
jgi:hypothetical protein